MHNLSECRRALRHPFVAGVQVTDIETERHVAAHLEDISPCGCFVETITSFAKDTRVELRISHCGEQVIAQGKVAYSRPNAGMGIVFVSLEPGSRDILDEWLDDLRI